MRESIKSLLEGVTLVDIVEGNKETIINLSFYDKQHGLNRDYPCINTCIFDNTGKDCFTKTYFSWTDFLKEVKAYISYYKAETPQNADSVYIKECEFL